MKSVSAKLSLFGVALAATLGALSYWLGRQSVGAASVGAPLAAGHSGGDELPSAQKQHLSPDLAAQADARKEVIGGEAVRALDQATALLVTAKVYEHDDRTLDQKYAGASLGQLLAAQFLLTEQRDHERDRIGAELIAKDRLIRITRQTGGDEPSPQPSSADGSPLSTVQVFEVVDGHAVEKAVTISGDEFPDYRALELEVWWIQCKVHDLKKSQQSAER